MLNSLTEVAQVPVSILGKIFKINFFPKKSDKTFCSNSKVVNMKFGAFVSFFGKLPIVSIGFPPNVIFAI